MKTIRKLQIGFQALLGIFLFASFLLAQTNSYSQNPANGKECIECHETLINKEYQHGPLMAGCTFCHKSNGQEHPLENVIGFNLVAEGSDLCFTCHAQEEEGIALNKIKHKPVAEGKCTDCHEVHSSNDPKLVFEKSPDLCYHCHTDIEKTMKEAAVSHYAATVEGGCIGCHSPHSTSERNILALNEKVLCLGCHNKVIMKGKRQIINMEKLLSESTIEHPALKKSCKSCHNPHAGTVKNLLYIPFPPKNYAVGTEENYALCYKCHDVEALTEETTQWATNFRNGEQNLHFLHVNKEKGRTCNNCHNVHASVNDHLIAKTVKFGLWDMPLNFVPTENGGSCATGCHKDWKYDRELAISN